MSGDAPIVRFPWKQTSNVYENLPRVRWVYATPALVALLHPLIRLVRGTERNKWAPKFYVPILFGIIAHRYIVYTRHDSSFQFNNNYVKPPRLIIPLPSSSRDKSLWERHDEDDILVGKWKRFSGPNGDRVDSLIMIERQQYLKSQQRPIFINAVHSRTIVPEGLY